MKNGCVTVIITQINALHLYALFIPLIKHMIVVVKCVRGIGGGCRFLDRNVTAGFVRVMCVCVWARVRAWQNTARAWDPKRILLFSAFLFVHLDLEECDVPRHVRVFSVVCVCVYKDHISMSVWIVEVYTHTHTLYVNYKDHISIHIKCLSYNIELLLHCCGLFIIQYLTTWIYNTVYDSMYL
jgi:hypothetical protein